VLLENDNVLFAGGKNLAYCIVKQGIRVYIACQGKTLRRVNMIVSWNADVQIGHTLLVMTATVFVVVDWRLDERFARPLDKRIAVFIKCKNE
jgi:hypothetical protein